MITPVNLNWKNQGWLKQLIDRSVHAVEFTKGRTNVLLKRWTFDLNAAGRQTISIASNFVYGLEATDVTSQVNIQFSRRDASQDLHPIVMGLGERQFSTPPPTSPQAPPRQLPIPRTYPAKRRMPLWPLRSVQSHSLE